jgi:phenylacetate-CoA ligase
VPEENPMNRFAGKVHQMISQRALLPFARARGLARKSARPVMLAYYQGLRFRQQSGDWSPEKKQLWILHRLRLCLRQAYEETPFYRQRFQQIGFDPYADFSFADFARLPVLEKADIREAGKGLLSKTLAAEQLVKDATGGSSGTPTEIWLGPQERGWRESAGEWFHRQLKIAAGTRTALLWGHHLDPVKRDGLRDRYVAFVNHQRWFDCFRLSEETLAGYHREFERWQPACIVAYASALGALAEYLREHGIVPGYANSCLVTGAEKLLPYHRKMIESVFHRPVHERYGSRDVGYIGYQLEPWGGSELTLDWANVLVEPETGEQTCSLLVTKLHADGMPMIRYRIGDLGSFAEGAETGHPSFTLKEVMGRDTDRIWLQSGRWVTGLQMPHLLKDFAVQEFQFIQHGDYSIELSIVPQKGFNDDSRKGILAAIGANLEHLPVNILLVDGIERSQANKWRPVISHVKAKEYEAS